MYRVASGLLTDFINGKKSPSKVFDCMTTGYYFALNRLLGTSHGHRWGNLRFYFNPYVEKLELIGFDDNFQERSNASISTNDFFNDEFVAQV